MKVLIVGAGPTGLTAGVELARRGIHAEIIDKRDEASTLSRAVGINPRSLEILMPSGVTAKLLAQGVKYKSLHFYHESKLWTTLALTTVPIQYGHNFILGLPQDQTEAILRDAFVGLGGTISYNTELVGIHQNDDQVIATTSAQSDSTYDCLIGADGVQSATRESLGIEYEGFELPDIWSIADVDADAWPHSDAFTICQLGKGKMAVVAPMGGNRFRIVSNTKDALAVLPVELNTTKIRRQGQFTISIRQVKEYRKGRVFLAGDAAHCHSPVGGRGMNLGIADSADLAARLASGSLASYSDDRHKDGKRIIAGSEQLRKALTSTYPFSPYLIRAVLKTISVVPVLQRKVVSRLMYG